MPVSGTHWYGREDAAITMNECVDIGLERCATCRYILKYAPCDLQRDCWITTYSDEALLLRDCIQMFSRKKTYNRKNNGANVKPLCVELGCDECGVCRNHVITLRCDVNAYKVELARDNEFKHQLLFWLDYLKTSPHQYQYLAAAIRHYYPEHIETYEKLAVLI